MKISSQICFQPPLSLSAVAALSLIFSCARDAALSPGRAFFFLAQPDTARLSSAQPSSHGAPSLHPWPLCSSLLLPPPAARNRLLLHAPLLPWLARSLSLQRRAPPPPLCSLAPGRSSLAHRRFSLCAVASLSPSSLSHGAPLSLSSFPSRALWSTPARASSHGVQSLAPQLRSCPWRLPLLGTASSSLCRAPC
jgi:hypothetical protein